ncbi:MAG: AAA family ATPase [Microscillaceae bacterium]|nr:AAA family ATPase [Microscillaceae bacterium]
MHPIRPKIQGILESISKGIYEKDEVIRLALLGAIAGESIFLLGPPGVAKSLIARKLKYAFKEGKSFEYLMSKFSTPDEIFGPVSIKKLKDEDKYERLTDKYLPGANIVFLDEIWKAGPSIQNALLTILNEKIYRNGEQEIDVNIRAIISASNEVPSLGEGVDALWDRFLVRYYMREIKNNTNFIRMITDTENVYDDTIPQDLKISDEEYASWHKALDQVEVPAEVLNTIQLIKYQLDELNASYPSPEDKIEVYDRRWKKIIRLLRTSAFLNGRAQVDLMDCFLISHCLWNKPSQFDRVMQMISETIRKHGYSVALNLATIKKEIQDFEEEVDRETKIHNRVFVDELLSIDRDYYEVLNLKQYFDGYLIKKADFARLGKEEQVSISLYDENYALTNRVNARLSVQENAIDIFYNSRTTTYTLKTQKIEKTETIQKKPHPIIHKYWDDRVATIEQYILEQNQKIAQESPDELNHLQENLFVHPRLSEIVESNMKDAIKALNSLKLRLEKLAFYYQNL